MVTVVMFQEGANGVFQFPSAAVNATAQLLFREQPKETLDQVKPGATGWGEVQMKARMTQQAALDQRGLMGAVVVENQMHFKLHRHCGINGFQEAAKLGGAMAAMKLADHGAGFGIERGEQVGG